MGFQVLYLGMRQVIGAAIAAIGLSMELIYLTSFRTGARWAPGGLFAVGALLGGGMLHAGHLLDRTTPAEPPLWILYAIAGLLVVAFGLSLVGGAMPESVGTAVSQEARERALRDAEPPDGLPAHRASGSAGSGVP